MPIGLLLSDDLLFISRIAGTARALGLSLQACRDVPALEAAARAQAPACVIVDLHHSGLDITRLIATLKATAKCTIVGYGSHVAADVLHAARGAGCDLVLPRSKFAESLADEMGKWFGAADLKPPKQA